VLKDIFTSNDIQQLNDLKELKIYFATTWKYGHNKI
jgi:hypothetical protein